MASELVQIIYKDEQASSCFPFATLYFNNILTRYFENSVIKSIVNEATTDKISVCSWKLKEKLRWYIGNHRELTQEVLESDYDVLAFTKNTSHHQMLSSANVHHPGFREILKKISVLSGIKMPDEVRTPIYQNHFSAKTEIYQDYVRDYLEPVMFLMENEPEINEMVMRDSNYSALNKQDAAKSDWLMEKIGLPYYPLSPFILERLFSIFCHNHKIRITPL